MKSKKDKKCKYKGCDNPVLEGKYCVYHTQVMKEKRDKVLLVVGGVVIPAVGVAIKKGALKKFPEIAAKVVQIVLKR